MGSGWRSHEIHMAYYTRGREEIVPLRKLKGTVVGKIKLPYNEFQKPPTSLRTYLYYLFHLVNTHLLSCTQDWPRVSVLEELTDVSRKWTLSL
jgi:hypothetical protein